jgi:hypothetical protein
VRGYGDSSKPEGAPDHSNYSKRAMATDMVEVMAALAYYHWYFLIQPRPQPERLIARDPAVWLRAVFDDR